jgi:hypothetical protein
MPTRWRLTVPAEPDLAAQTSHDQLHGMACGFLGFHSSGEAPFAVTPPTPTAGPVPGWTLAVTWLTDDLPAGPEQVTEIRLGRHVLPVLDRAVESLPHTTLDRLPLADRATLTVLTPAVFKHRGADYPLPDPAVTLASLARRHASVTDRYTPDDELQELTRGGTVIYHHQIHTQTFTYEGDTSAGFVGTVTLGLRRTVSVEARRLFTTLTAFAGLAGLGRGTTHGLGVTRTTHRTHHAGQAAGPRAPAPARPA